MNPKERSQLFDRVIVINLSRRTDRWNEFQKHLPDDWPFAKPIRFDAIDGRNISVPKNWSSCSGSWGCYLSHLAAIQRCLSDGIESVLILEDDALFTEHFVRDVNAFLDKVPNDWGMIYFGGEHNHPQTDPPRALNEWVYKPYSVQRLHAYALRGNMLQRVYDHLFNRDPYQGRHVDHHVARVARKHKDFVYSPAKWLVGQRKNSQDVDGRRQLSDSWQDIHSPTVVNAEEQPFVAILGLHSSGSSVLAGVVHTLGIHLGNKLTGYWGKGYEAQTLVQICQGAMPFPATNFQWKPKKIKHKLRKWINDRRREALEMNTIAAGKYPQLCCLGDHLREVCGSTLRVITSDRPVDESVRSIQRRCPGMNHDKLAAHQRLLADEKERFVQTLGKSDLLRVPYHELIGDPLQQIQRIIEFLEIEPSRERIDAAISLVDPKKRHVFCCNST